MTELNVSKITFPTEDGMTIGQPIVHIDLENEQYVEISARDFDEISIDFGHERCKWRKQTGQSLKKELNLKLWALTFVMSQVEDRQVAAELEKLRFNLYALIASMEE